VPAAASVHVRGPAKINLHLSVGPRRPDGFHELVTVFHAVDVFDDVTATPAPGLSVSVTGEGADKLPADERNLAWRAAGLLAETTGVDPNVHLQVHKSIPIAAGMAGGSADAAAALVACARLWGVAADLPELAAQLGSDVAFPLLGGNAVGRGRGEQLLPLSYGSTLHWALSFADFEISTPAAYAAYDRLNPNPESPPHRGLAELLRAISASDLDSIAAELYNALQPAALALHPELQHTLDAGADAGALAGIVSGSGPTCAFLCSSAAHAKEVAAALPARSATATGPAPGVRVVS
jgi:4-diphosphocytidyl-2-C-methyl-D-erythritol kinase